jgi:hypothetical protein
MKMIKRIIGLGLLGWAKVTLGFGRLGYAMFQAGTIATHSADKRARRWRAGL